MTGSKDKPEKIVVVVHGVGDPEPGDTLNLFARSLAESEQPLVEQREAVWLSEKSNDAYVQTYPVHKRKLQFADQQLELCETFWGDLSRVRKGIFGIIQGLFQVIFGLRYVAYVAADQPGQAALWLKRLGLTTSKILHGPVAAVTYYLVLLMLAVCATHLMWPESYIGAFWTQVVLASVGAVAIATSIIGYRLTTSRVVERFWFWVNVTAMFVTGLMFLKSLYIDASYPALDHDGTIHPGLLLYCRVLLTLLGLLWFIEIQVLFAMAVCWFVSLRHPKAYRPALHVAFLLPAAAVGIWGQALPMMWVSAKEGIAIIGDLPKFSAVFDDAIPFLGVQLLMSAILLTATAITVTRYFNWRAKATVESFDSGNRAPRLIVNAKLQLVLAVCTISGVCMVSGLCILQMLSVSYTEFWYGQLMVEANKYALGVVVPLLGFLVVLLPKLRPGFDIVLDVVNHFYFRPTHLTDVLDDDDEFDIAETTFENGSLYFSRRDLIHNRLVNILAYYRDQYHHHPELVIISHSQGTMAAIEVLNNEDIAWINNAFQSVTLVTMGSPLNHLYQHYFGHYYPELSQPYWSSLRRRLDRWVNICRIDDYVGTDLAFPSSLQDSATESCFTQPLSCENHAVGPRGHVSYWSDGEVLSIIQKEILDLADHHNQKAA